MVAVVGQARSALSPNPICTCIHGLGAVLAEDYTGSSAFDFDQNQMFYYALQEALLEAPQAPGFFKTAAKWDGHGAYNAVHRAYYTFMGPTTAALLLKKLANLRFKASETPTAFVMRLVELFDDLEEVPGEAFRGMRLSLCA